MNVNLFEIKLKNQCEKFQVNWDRNISIFPLNVLKLPNAVTSLENLLKH